jgi:hypothetical protein
MRTIRQLALKSLSRIRWLVSAFIILFVIQSIAVMIVLNQKQKSLLYPNAKENREWREWHIDLTGKKYFNIYFSSIRNIFLVYSNEKNYSSTDKMEDIEHWYLQEKGCKGFLTLSTTEWIGYCSKRHVPPLKTVVAFPYQEIYVTNNGMPKDEAAITITTKWSLGIELLLLPTDLYFTNPPD